MSGFRNVFACLVHESQECVIDLVRNLRYLDAESVILLYDGGRDATLLNGAFPFEAYGAVVHPNPQPQSWGRLHGFALDCMQYAIDHGPFDALTIVDSDQLGVRQGYSAYLAEFFARAPGIGLAGNSPGVQPRTTRVGPVIAAHKELELWRPFLGRFDGGLEKFAHWTFWPSTVFSAGAARDLTRLFATDHQLQDIMARSRIWATEEVIFPTLVALLGYGVVENPCSYEYVKHRVAYSTRDADRALGRPSVFWMHPVNRRYDDRLRGHLRERLRHYEKPSPAGGRMETAAMSTRTERPPFLTVPILERMRAIEGWLEDDEADLLIAVTVRLLAELPPPHVVVEVGSYCGRSTVVFGSVLRNLGSDGRVYAVDPHDGVVGALDRGLRAGPSTLARFERNIADAGLRDLVVTVQQRSFDVAWEQPISLLFIDGLHDYANVARDFHHFEPHVVPGGYVAFHDYADYYPGVKAFVNEQLATGAWEQVLCVRSMMVLRRRAGERRDGARTRENEVGVRAGAEPAGEQTRDVATVAVAVAEEPLVSCIMPTANRRSLVAQAVEYFLRQDYRNRELIIVDDGVEPVGDVVRRDPRIRYMRLDRKATVGAKRNLACEAAGGDVIAHWDDDDWYAAGRLTRQVRQLLAGGRDVCGLDRLLFYDPLADSAWEVQPGVGTVSTRLLCGTLCYRRDVWRDRRFADDDVNEEEPLLRDRAVEPLPPSDAAPWYVGILHRSNARPWRPVEPEWQPRPVDAIRSAMGGDCVYYDTVFQAGRPRPRAGGAHRAAGDSGPPLVTCLMPTYNRALFVPQAIRCFLAQDYPHKELIIVDDGEERVGPEVAGGELVRYVALDRRLSLGAKRNLAADLGTGEILAHWDDDDWYGPRYLTRLVAALVQKGQESLVGVSRYLVYLLSTGSLKICASRGPAGATFCYWRRIWERHPYRDAARAEDFFFLEAARPRVHGVNDPELFAVVRHRHHTWTRENGRDVNRRLSALPPYRKPFGAIVGAEAAAFYERARLALFANVEVPA